MSSLSDDQHMARVSVSKELWLEFRALAVRRERSVAAYLGHLVQKELGRVSRVEKRRAARQPKPKLEPESEIDGSWVPPWEI
jgi:hypothetical protein